MELQNKYFGLASHKGKAKLPSGSADNGILWPENDGKEIQKIWTGRKYSGTPAKYANILR